MNKKVLVIIVVILLLLLGGWYFMTKKSPSATSPATSTDSTQESAGGSLKDLITKGVAQTCTFTTAGSTGTVYVSGGKVRGDFDVTVDNQITKSHMIVMDSTSYIWTEGQKTGFKMSFDSSATPATTTGASSAANAGFDPSANNNYKCSAGVADGSLFSLPAGVTFSTFAVPSGATQGAPSQDSSGSSGSSSSQCSYCDSLTGDSKTQCLTALKCN